MNKVCAFLSGWSLNKGGKNLHYTDYKTLCTAFVSDEDLAKECDYQSNNVKGTYKGSIKDVKTVGDHCNAIINSGNHVFDAFGMSCTEENFHSEAAFLANYYAGKLLNYNPENKPKTVVLYGILQPCDKCQEKLKTASNLSDFLKGVPIRYLMHKPHFAFDEGTVRPFTHFPG